MKLGLAVPRRVCAAVVNLKGVELRIPTQIDTHSAGKTTLVPIEIGTCSDANRHPV
jgi:hypothetical protein